MRYLGLDIGTKRIGVALSDPTGFLASPYQVLEHTSWEKTLNAIEQVVQEFKVQALVLGLPRNMDGSLGEKARMAQDMGSRLAECLGLPVHYYDERLSTVAAERTLIGADMSRAKRKKVVDKLAAQIILQAFLDSQASRRHENGQ